MTRGMVTGVSVAHGYADLDAIEVVGATDERHRLARLCAHEAVSEAFVLETCNRSEAYVVTRTQEGGRAALAEEIVGIEAVNARWFGHDEALEHLLRVGAGLESMILGEDEILGQVRTARETARAADALGPVLAEATEKAIRVGERARTETAINDGVISIGRAAVDIAAERGELGEWTVAVVGAGEMGANVAQALADNGVDRLLLCNRTRDRAATLAARLDVAAAAHDLATIADAVARSDVVITATGSPEPLLDRTTFEGAGETLVIDIAQPRDVVPAVSELPAVELLDLDALEARTSTTERQRTAAVETVERIIDEELDRLDVQLKRKQADAVIRVMYEGAMAIKRRELQTAFEKLDGEEDRLSQEEREILEAMADAIVGQILAAPTKSLREAAEHERWETLQTALQLFDPSFADGAVNADEQPGGTAPGRIADDS